MAFFNAWPSIVTRLICLTLEYFVQLKCNSFDHSTSSFCKQITCDGWWSSSVPASPICLPLFLFVLLAFKPSPECQLFQNCSIDSLLMSLNMRRLAFSYSCSRSSKLFALRSSKLPRSGHANKPCRYSSKLWASLFRILLRDGVSSLNVSVSRDLKRI